jgi:hypothetical protein
MGPSGAESDPLGKDASFFESEQGSRRISSTWKRCSMMSVMVRASL